MPHPAPDHTTGHTTGHLLGAAAQLITYFGLHRGPHFASEQGGLDPVAAIYRAATSHTPNAFLGRRDGDDDIARALIEARPDVMTAARHLADHIDTPHADPIEAIADWLTWPRHAPPGESEVIGRMLRLARHLTHAPAA